jgi:hypothetical protein
MIASVLAAPVPTNSVLNKEARPFRVELAAEVGLLAPLSHEYQTGKDGTTLDYIAEGGQDNLFPVSRWSVDLRLRERTTFTLLYQPLQLRTQQVATRDLRFNQVEFVAGTPIDFLYGFDFYRLSYTYDLFEEDRRDLELGVSLQIRNATIDFTSANGELRSSTRDVGPVPVLKARGRFESGQRTWWGFEADGFYAPIKYLNGGSSDVVGAILDASLRAGLKASNGTEPFLNVRYLTGGSEGTTSDPDIGKDGYSSNWLGFMTVTIGFYLR